MRSVGVPEIDLRRLVERSDVRWALIAVGCALALLIGYALGSAGDGRPPAPAAAKGASVADLMRVRKEGETQAADRYAAGIAEGRAEFAPGSPARRRVYTRGVRAGRAAMAPKLRARFTAGVAAGEQAAEKSYRSGRADGYDVGYDDGWDDGYDDGVAGSDLGSSPSPAPSDAEDLPDVGYDLDCSDFSGPVYVSPGDPHGLDADGDGVGCE
jgi:hypothetical protein